MCRLSTTTMFWQLVVAAALFPQLCSAIPSQVPLKSSITGFPVKNPTKSFWTHSEPDANPLETEGSTGAIEGTADVCIIGSGISGISTAYHLSRSDATKKLKTVIFEARNFCSGATGRNGGHLTPYVTSGFVAYETKYGTEQAVRSLELENYNARELVKIIEENDLAVDLVTGGHIRLTTSADDYEAVKADYNAAYAAGMNLSAVYWISKEEMQETYGIPFAALHTPAYNLWPLKLVTNLYKLAQATMKDNLSLHTQTLVTSVTGSSSSRWTLNTDRGTTECKYVVYATNAYTTALVPQIPVTPTRGQLIALRSNTTLEKLGKASWSNGAGEYWFPRPLKSDDEAPLVILGGGKAGEYESGILDDSTLNPRISKNLRDFLWSLLPAFFVKDHEPEMEWTGIMGYTDMEDPFVGPLVDVIEKDKFKGQFVSAGFSGHGMPRTYACAEVVVSMIAEDLVRGDLETWKAPEWLPERYLTWNRI
ncbi:FAD dependent oxidoreductase-domain-containing protein [Mycena floridula]|nr:FAD dependent oxidoreductase-domain-containing protein [Mycena floridula]